MSAAPTRAPAAAWYALAVLVMTTLFAFLDRQIISLVAPSLQASLGLSDLELGALQGLGMAIFASIASYPMGWLADRFGRRLMLGLGVAIWSLSTAACAFQHSFADLFVGTIGIAVGEAGLGPIVFALIPDLFPERQRNAANLVYFAAALLGAAVGLGFGGLTLQWLADHHASLPGFLSTLEPWRVALLIVAAPGPLFVVLVATIRVRGSAASAASLEAATITDFLPFARERAATLACIFGAIACYSLPLTSVVVWLPIAVPRVFGTEPASVGVGLGIAVGIGTLTGLALPVIGGRLRRGEVGPLVLASLFTGMAVLPSLSLFLAAAPWHAYLAVGAQVCLGVGTAALMPGVLQEIAPDHLRARVLSLLGIVTGVTQGISPLLVGWLSDLFAGPRGIFVAMILVGAPGWLASALLYRRGRTLLRV